jgi:hypothetical protein
MPRWLPKVDVVLTEQIGRRLFDEPMLRGAAGQPSYSGLTLTHFEETRDREVSLDRLGASGIDRRVVRYLAPRAEAAGRSFRNAKAFDGWAVVPARELVQARKPPRLPVIASPIIDKPEPEDNVYHAHVARPDDLTPYFMALHLRLLFTNYGRVEQHIAESETPLGGFWGHPIVKWIREKLQL